MEKILPIGTVVSLKNGSQKIMIINRGALYNSEGTIGYFDYSACLYPFGQTDQRVLFFNADDIAEIYFEGYRDETEEEFCREYREKIKDVSYPKFKIEEAK